MNHLPEDPFYTICEFTRNEGIFLLALVNRFIARLCSKPFFIDYIRYRDHPIVFNLIDNYCFKCNLKCRIITEGRIINCSHLSLKKNNYI